MADNKRLDTISRVARIFAQAVQDVLQASTNSRVTYAPTMQKVPSISMKPDLGCFVQFNGDYSGLFIMNLSGPAALELYRRSMTYMGMPEDGLANDYTSDDVVNAVGEIINQVIGRARSMVEAEYGLTATNNQPKAITISSAITLSVATMLDRAQCRRISFKTEDNHSFHVEMSLEQTEFIRLFPKEERELSSLQTDVDDLLENRGL